MIWYRYWLELRYWMLLVAALVLLGSLAFLIMMYTPVMKEQRLSWVAEELPHYADRIATMGTERFVVWTAHVWVSGFVTFFAALAVGGTYQGGGGFRQKTLFYTLSLPIERFRVVWTRVAAGLALTTAANILMFAINSAIITATGHAAPWEDLVLTSASAALSSFAFIAVLQLSRWVPWGLGLVAMAPIFWAPAHVDQLAVWGPTVLVCIVTGMVAFGLSAWAAERRDI